MTQVIALKRKLRRYISPEKLEEIEAAYQYSENAHNGQLRESGKPFFSHPATVADILADWKLDNQTITAALLHDTVEDTPITLNQIEETFGQVVANLVNGVSKIGALEAQNAEERQAESFRKILLAVSQDWRVIFIKLADRLHNMRTLIAIQSSEKRKRIATETLEIYAPIAERLSLFSVRNELQDLALRHLHPNRHRVLVKALKHVSQGNRKTIDEIQKALTKLLSENGIEASVSGRTKNLYSIYKKMVDKKLSFAEVEDIIGFRVIVPEILECYATLGVIHQNFRPVPGKINDYIAAPKENGYQSLHTTVINKVGTPIEYQIRTSAMHNFAEQGVAAHWLYKEGLSDDANAKAEIQNQANLRLQSLIKLHSENIDSSEFLEHVKIDLFPNEVSVMTPRGKIIALPKGASALDFAYAIHTDLGNQAGQARVNGQKVPIATKLNTGDIVEIIKSATISPRPHWINFVRTAKAKSYIRHFLKTTGVKESMLLGEKLLSRALAKQTCHLEHITTEQWEDYFKGKHVGSKHELFKNIGLGVFSVDIVAHEIIMTLGGKKAYKKSSKNTPPIIIAGARSTAVNLADCCQPIPREPITGILRKSKGLVVHRYECPELLAEIRKSDKNIVDVSWDEKVEGSFRTSVVISCCNRKGIAYEIIQCISESLSNIVSINLGGGEAENHHITINLTIEVNDHEMLDKVLSALRAHPDIVSTSRQLLDNSQ